MSNYTNNYLDKTGNFVATVTKVVYDKEKYGKPCLRTFFAIEGKLADGKFVDWSDRNITHCQNYFLRKSDRSVNFQTLALLQKCFEVELKANVDPEIEMLKMLGLRAMLKIGTWTPGDNPDKKFFIAKETNPVPAGFLTELTKKVTGPDIMFDEFPF